MATLSYPLMYFVPQFTEATDIITLKSVIFSSEIWRIYEKIVASSSNDIFYI